jgi:hypothetical protein
MKTLTLSDIALDNLLFLNKSTNFIINKYKLNNNKFESSKDDTFDTIYSLKELEYPLYFTVYQLLNEIHTSYDYTINGHNKTEIINMLDGVTDMLYMYYETCEETSPTFEKLLDDIDDKVFFIQGYYKYGICFWLPTKFKNYLNWFCIKTIQVSKEIVNGCENNEITDIDDDTDIDDEDDEDEDDKYEDDDKDDKDDKDDSDYNDSDYDDSEPNDNINCKKLD